MYSRFECCRIGRDKKSTGLCTFGSDFKTSLEVLKTMFENSFLFVASKQGVGRPEAFDNDYIVECFKVISSS